ncbi:hypothetical protein Ddc_08504 [Ditylenchus destructor]|nr:hypothetical protein Ddc_08504 [Ditylenchus destructor]
MIQWPLHRRANSSGQARPSRRAGPDKSSYNNIGRAIAENRQMNASRAKPFVLVITPNNFCSKVVEGELIRGITSDGPVPLVIRGSLSNFSPYDSVGDS